MGEFIPRFQFWNPGTWAIPSLYWDSFSNEQRFHAICKQLGKVIAYSDYLGVNVDNIAARLKAIEEGQLDPYIVAEIEQWFEDNQPAIVQALSDLADADTAILGMIGTGFDPDNTIADNVNALNDNVDALLKDNFSVLSYAMAGSGLVLAGSYEFNNVVANPDYVNGGVVNGNKLVTLADTGDYDDNIIVRVFDMNTGSLLNTTTLPFVGHPSSTSYANGYYYICTALSYNTRDHQYMYKVDENFQLVETIDLKGAVYAVAKTLETDSANGLFIGLSRGASYDELVHFNTVNGEIDIVKSVPVYAPKTSNGLCLVRDEKFVAINAIQDSSVSVFDIETGRAMGECSVACERFCEIEDSFLYDGEYYLLFAVSETSYYRKTSQTIGLAKLALFNDSPKSTSAYHYNVNAYTVCYCEHGADQRLTGDGSSNNPISSLSFAIGMLSEVSSGVRIIVTGDSTFRHIPAIQYTHSVQIEKLNAADYVELNDYVLVVTNAFLRILIDKISGYDTSVTDPTANYYCVRVAGATVELGASEYCDSVSAAKYYQIGAERGAIVYMRQPDAFDSIYLYCAEFFANFTSVVPTKATIVNSKVEKLYLGNSTDNETEICNFISENRINKLLANITDIDSNFYQVLLTSTTEHKATFTGVGYNNTGGVCGVRMFKHSDGYLVVDGTKTNLQITSLFVVS